MRKAVELDGQKWIPQVPSWLESSSVFPDRMRGQQREQEGWRTGLTLQKENFLFCGERRRK